MEKDSNLTKLQKTSVNFPSISSHALHFQISFQLPLPNFYHLKLP